MHLDGVPVDRIMTTGVVTVTAETSVTEAADILRTNRFDSLVVTDGDGNGKLRGMLTSADFVDIVSDGGGDGMTVEQYMTRDVVTIPVAADIQTAAAKMITKDVRHLPVVSPDEEVVGMLSSTDLARFLAYATASDS